MAQRKGDIKTFFKPDASITGKTIVKHVALSTAASACTGYIGSRWLTSSGWGYSTIADDSLQYVGATLETPSSVGAEIDVVVEGLAENLYLQSTLTTFAAGDMCMMTSDAPFSTGTTWTSPPSTRTMGVFMSSGTGIGDVWLFDQTRQIDSTT